MKLQIILEKGDGEYWGRLESKDAFLFTTVADSTEEVCLQLKELLADFIAHEGQEHEEWKNVKIENITFTHTYDLTALFHIFDVLKINTLAELSGINKSLMRQYAVGIKHPSKQQAEKITNAIKILAQKLQNVQAVF